MRLKFWYIFLCPQKLYHVVSRTKRLPLLIMYIHKRMVYSWSRIYVECIDKKDLSVFWSQTYFHMGLNLPSSFILSEYTEAICGWMSHIPCGMCVFFQTTCFPNSEWLLLKSDRRKMPLWKEFLLIGSIIWLMQDTIHSDVCSHYHRVQYSTVAYPSVMSMPTLLK